MRSASRESPSANVARMWRALATTWLLVRRRPSGVKAKPLPEPLAPLALRTSICATAGPTRSAAATTAREYASSSSSSPGAGTARAAADPPSPSRNFGTISTPATWGRRSLSQGVLRRVLEPDLPVRPIAERLVLRSAAAAQRVVLLRGAVTKCHGRKFDAAGHCVRPVVHHRDHRLARGRLRFDAVPGIAQRPGGAFLDRGDHLRDCGAIGVDPGLGIHPKHFLQTVSAEPGVGADRAVVEDGDVLTRKSHPPIPGRIGRVAVRKAVPAVRPIAEGLVGRATAAAQRDAADGLAR